MSLGLAMRLELTAPVWLMARGTSMLPWRMPGCEMKLQPVGPALAIGEILVFRHGAKLYYHRVIERISPNQWRTKGDTLINSDEPVSDRDIVGRVTAVRRGNRVREVRPDRGAASLSRRLGRCFGRFGRPSGWLTRLGTRVAYLVLLLSAWPFRRLLARGELELDATAGAEAMGKD